MESGIKHESFPRFDPEREFGGSEREPTPEREKTETELLLEAFENGSRFDDEDEKARNYNARLDKADELQEEVDVVNESITLKSQQLMGLSLTPEQQRLLFEIEQLMAQRKQVADSQQRDEIDRLIDQKTKRFTALPVTPEQAGLLDEIIAMISERETLETSRDTILG